MLNELLVRCYRCRFFCHGGHREPGCPPGQWENIYWNRARRVQRAAAEVQAWQNEALCRDSMLELFLRGEVLPEGRTNEEETRVTEAGRPDGQGARTKAESGN